MKNIFRTLGFIALAAVIGFGMAACDDGGGSGGGGTKSCTVTFDLQGGNISGSTANVVKTVDSGKSLGTDMPADPKKADNDFGGWFTQQNGAGSQFTSATVVTSTITVYSKWTEVIPDITYTLEQVGGENEEADSTGIKFTFSKSIDSFGVTAADITVSGAAEKGTEAAFTGSGTDWTLSPIIVNSAGLAKVEISKEGIEGDEVEVVVYKEGEAAPEYWNITWHLNNGEWPANSGHHQFIEKGTTLPEPSNPPSRSGFTFIGWYSDSDLTIPYTFGSAVNDNLDLYAKWKAPDITYTLAQTGGADGTADSTGIAFTFSASIDSLGVTVADITVGGVAAKGAGAAFTGSGTSWTLSPITVSEAGIATVEISKEGIEGDKAEVQVFKAGETGPEYWHITWHLNDGEWQEDTVHHTMIEKGETLSSPSKEPVKTGNTFGGWYSNVGLTTAYTFGSAVNGNLDLYAKWNPIVKTVSVGTQNGTVNTGIYGTVTFHVTTENIAIGEHSVSVANLPAGVSVSGNVTIGIGGTGTLTLTCINTAAAGTTSTLTLTIDGTTSAAFTLTIDPAVDTTVAPPVPVLTAVPISPTSIAISWNRVSNASVSYEIEYSIGEAGDDWRILYASNAIPITYSHTELTVDTTYNYRIRAQYVSGMPPDIYFGPFSAWSEPVSATTLASDTIRRITVNLFDTGGTTSTTNGATIGIRVNGTQESTLSCYDRDVSRTYSFNANEGDKIEIYLISGTNLYENSFIAYYTDNPPSPAFNPPYALNVTNALAYKLPNSLSGADINTTLGSFTVQMADYTGGDRKVRIDMFSSFGGWGGGSIGININNEPFTTATLYAGNFSYYEFDVNTNDNVEFIWNAGSDQDKNSFIAYYTDTRPVPAFTSGNNNSWSSTLGYTAPLAYKLRGQMTDIADNTSLGSFSVGTPAEITQRRITLDMYDAGGTSWRNSLRIEINGVVDSTQTCSGAFQSYSFNAPVGSTVKVYLVTSTSDILSVAFVLYYADVPITPAFDTYNGVGVYEYSTWVGLNALHAHLSYKTDIPNGTEMASFTVTAD